MDKKFLGGVKEVYVFVGEYSKIAAIKLSDIKLIVEYEYCTGVWLLEFIGSDKINVFRTLESLFESIKG